MKNTHLLQTALATLACATLSFPRAALGIAYTLHADVDMTNLRWDVVDGSSIDWLSDWELMASASSFDSVNGFAGDYQVDSGQPATAAASSDSGYSQAGAQVEVDSAGIPLGLRASLHLALEPGVTFASGFSTAMAYREFVISGGSGDAAVTFGYDYVAHLIGDISGWGADYRALLSISDGTTTYDLVASDLRMDPVNATFSNSLSKTFHLNAGTPYSITLSVDPDQQVPDGGPGVLLTALVLLLLCRLAATRQSVGYGHSDLIAPRHGRPRCRRAQVVRNLLRPC